MISKDRVQEVSFTVQSIGCIACSPIFRRALSKVDGVLEVKELPITNKIVVVFDGFRLGRGGLIEEIGRIAKRAGLGGRIIVVR